MRAHAALTWAALTWVGLACLLAVPLGVAAASPYLAYRTPVYVVASFAGIVALGLLLVQPLLAGGDLPGLQPRVTRRWHHWTGAALVVAVLLHVGGLYLTSPQDALDALLLVSPTPFSVWGVIGLWTVVLTALLVALRGRLRLRPATWNAIHNGLALVVVGASVVHALLIEGLMGEASKWALCAAAVAASVTVVVRLRLLRPLRRG